MCIGVLEKVLQNENSEKARCPSQEDPFRSRSLQTLGLGMEVGLGLIGLGSGSGLGLELG